MGFDPSSRAAASIRAARLDGASARAGDLLAEELTRCSDCGRTPLIGEQVHLYESAELVCELCRMLRPDASLLSATVTHSLGPGIGSDPVAVVRVTRR
jgi:hypothetical protein